LENRAVVLLSGGIDSSVCLYIAKKQGFLPFLLSFDYGQRHKKELASARKIAEKLGLDIVVVKLKLPWLSSSLIDKNKSLFTREKIDTNIIPQTYISARNLIFLSIAVSYAEEISAKSIFVGANTIDFSGYPDCRDEFLESFFETARLGTKAGITEYPISIERPLINKSKKEIILLGKELSVPFELTWSCYKGEKKPCNECESCIIRKKGFSSAGITDPLS